MTASFLFIEEEETTIENSRTPAELSLKPATFRSKPAGFWFWVVMQRAIVECLKRDKKHKPKS